MKTKTTETTKTTQTINYNRTIQDDNSVDIARMSAIVTSGTPFGNCSMVVLNKSLFDTNKDDIKKLYIAFEQEVAETQLSDDAIEKEDNDSKED